MQNISRDLVQSAPLILLLFFRLSFSWDFVRPNGHVEWNYQMESML